MNSFRAVERALEYEAGRQYHHWQQTGQILGQVPKQTRGWDDQAQVTRAQRHKEESSDYRYFPEPDLVPVQVSDQQIAELRDSLGTTPTSWSTRGKPWLTTTSSSYKPVGMPNVPATGFNKMCCGR